MGARRAPTATPTEDETRAGRPRRLERIPSDVPKDGGCPKCGHANADPGEISTTGTGLSKLFDVQTNTFRPVTCTNCGSTELYEDVGSSGSDLVDVFFG